MFHGKYRIATARLKGWDYAGGGFYFLTICTKGRVNFLGEIVDGEMILSPMGEIVGEEWQKTSAIRPYVELGAWVVMPNHFHAILAIDGLTSPAALAGRQERSNSQEKKPNWAPGSLGAITNQFKTACTKRIWKAGFRNFAWQTRYYDHIIRDGADLQNCTDYILTNPTQWDADNLRQDHL